MAFVMRDTPIEALNTILNKRDISLSGKHPFTSQEIWTRQFNDKDFLFFMNREHEDRIKVMLDGGMKNQYLGACLDYVRFGAMNACFWNVQEGNVKGLMNFIQQWRDINRENLIWSDKPMPQTLELPYIHHDECPRTKLSEASKQHKGTLVDRGGRIRCAHIEKKEVKPSFTKAYQAGIDPEAMMDIQEFYEEHPREPVSYDEHGELEDIEPDNEEYQKYLRDKEQYETEEPVEVIRPCYAIISEPRDKPMPLEKMLSRLNIYKHSDGYVGYPFCGWTLAWYVQKWHEQSPDGKAPLWMPEGEKDAYRVWPDFRVVGSDD